MPTRAIALALGLVALPSLLVQALAPTAGAWLLTGGGTSMLATLTTAAVAVLVLVALLAHRAGKTTGS